MQLTRRPARRSLRPAAAAATAVMLVSACGVAGPGRAESASGLRLAGEVSGDDAVDHVVAISVDGLNPAAIRRLGPSGAPAFHRLLAEGAGTLNARTERELTRTLPNHTGMVTGRPVRGAAGHGVTFNEDNGSTVRATAGHYVAGMFDVVHDHGGSTSFYSSKTKFDLLDRTWDATHGAPDRVAPDNGRDKIDRYFVDTEPRNVDRLIAQLRTAPDDLTFLHLAEPDTAGHARGFMSRAYLSAVSAADAQVGRILDAVSADATLSAHVAVVLTADHGGRGPSHSDPTAAYDYTVPFLVWGPGVAHGSNLYDLNVDRRRSPGRQRTSYTGLQPVRNGEVANLVTDLLDLPDVPGSVFNRRHLLVSR